MRLQIGTKALLADNVSVFQRPYERRMEVIKTFKSVQSKIYNMDGGAGTLQTAVDHISDRIQKHDQPDAEKIKTAGERLGVFLQNAASTDKKVAAYITVKQMSFFLANPWAIPPAPPKKKSTWQKIKDGFKKVGKAIVKGVKKAVNWIKDTAKKAWKATVDFCKKHWKAIVKIAVGVVVIAGLAALSVFTGGAAAPLFAVAAKGAAIAACSGAAVSVVTGVAQGKSAGEIFDSAADSFMVGSITGAATGFAGAAAGSVTSATGSKLLGELVEQGINTGAKMLAKGASYAIDNGTLKGYMKKEGWGILKDGAMSCLKSVGSYMTNVGKDLLGKAFGGLKTSQLANSFKKAYEWCQDKVPTLTKVATNTISKTFGNMSIGDLIKLKNPSEFAKGIGKSLVNNFVSEASGSIGDFVNKDLNNITGGAVDKIKDFAGGVISDFKQSDFGQTITQAYDTVNGLVDNISGAYQKLDSAFSKVSGQIDNILGDKLQSVGNLIGGSVVDKLSGTVSQMVGEFKGVTGSYAGLKGDLAGAVKNLAERITTTAGDALTSSIGDVSNIVGKINTNINTAIGAFDKISTGFKGINGSFGDVMKNVLINIPKTIPATMYPRPNTIIDNIPTAGSVVTRLRGVVTSTVQNAVLPRM